MEHLNLKQNSSPSDVLALTPHEIPPLPRLRQPPCPSCLVACGGALHFEVETEDRPCCFCFCFLVQQTVFSQRTRPFYWASLGQTVTPGSSGMASRVLNRHKIIEHDRHDRGKSTWSWSKLQTSRCMEHIYVKRMQLGVANCVFRTRRVTQCQAVLERSGLSITSQLDSTDSQVDTAVTVVIRR